MPETGMKLEIYRALRTAQDKYTYFMLAAAGAAIGFAVNQTQGAAISWSQLPLAGGVLAWGLSFVFGSFHLAYVSAHLYANAELLDVQSGQHREWGNDPQIAAAASEGLRGAMQSNSTRAGGFGHWQFRMLIVGGLLYITWHILEMALRTDVPAVSP